MPSWKILTKEAALALFPPVDICEMYYSLTMIGKVQTHERILFPSSGSYSCPLWPAMQDVLHIIEYQEYVLKYRNIKWCYMFLLLHRVIAYDQLANFAVHIKWFHRTKLWNLSLLMCMHLICKLHMNICMQYIEHCRKNKC